MGLSNSIVALCFLLACTTPRATGPANRQMNYYYTDRGASIVRRVPSSTNPSVQVPIDEQERKLQFERLNNQLQQAEDELRDIKNRLPPSRYTPNDVPGSTVSKTH